MLKVLIIDKSKNTIVIDLHDDKYNQVFEGEIESSKIKKHKTMKELDKEVHDYLKEGSEIK